ncbi:unnamed protein product, partial [Ectocarpus fasciculatus]
MPAVGLAQLEGARLEDVYSPFPEGGGGSGTTTSEPLGITEPAPRGGWGSPVSDPGSPQEGFSPTRAKERRSAIAFGGGGAAMAALSKEQGRRRSRRDIPEPDFVVSTEFLHRREGQAIILVISNLRVLCVRAYLSRNGGIGGNGSGIGGRGMTGGTG